MNMEKKMNTETKQVYIPIVKVTFEYNFINENEINILSVGGHKFPVQKVFDDGNTYDIFKYNHTVAIYKRTEKKKSFYYAWGISSRDTTFDESIGEQVHTYEWAEPVKIKSSNRKDIEYASPVKPTSTPYSKFTEWSTYELTTFKADVWKSKFFQYQDKIRIKEAEDYKKKQEKYARENRAICGACERYIERWDEGNWNGVIYDHGFKQVGFRAGTCVGARHQCWEKSTDGKVAYINELQSQKDHLLNNKPDEKFLAKLLQQVEKYVAFKNQLEELQKEHKEAYEEEVDYFDRNQNKFVSWLRINKDIKIIPLYPVSYLDRVHVWKETTLDELLNVWEQMIAYLTGIIDREQIKVDNWKEQLTAKEKAAQS